MSRFDHLLAEIHAVTHSGPGIKKAGSMKDLADYLGHAPSNTSKWFSGGAPAPIPSATLSLKALRWVCEIRKVSDPTVDDLLLPDWETLRYILFRLLYGERFDLERRAKVYGTDPDAQAVTENYGIDGLASRLGVTVSELSAIVPYPWAPTPDPDGNFALDFLAFNLRAQSRAGFLEYVRTHLKPFRSGRTMLGFPGDLSKEQLDLVAEAERLEALYDSGKLVLPTWLGSIVL